MNKFALFFCILFAGLSAAAQETYMYAEWDTCSLYLDIYRPTAGSKTEFDGKAKPTVIFVFGGGFIMGERNEAFMQPWFQRLNDNGYTMVAIDYRLGMKGYDIGKGLSSSFKAGEQFVIAQQMGVEDLFSVKGAPEYPSAPCPVLMLHGTADQAVAYTKFGAVGRGIWGSDFLAAQWSRKRYTGWCIYRFKDRPHGGRHDRRSLPPVLGNSNSRFYL